MSEQLAPGFWQIGPETATGECGAMYLATNTKNGTAQGDEYVLFDCGPADRVLELEQALYDRGVDLRQHMMRIYITHSHSDHAGAAAVLQEAYPDNFEVFVGEGDLEAVRTGDYFATAGVFYHTQSLSVPGAKPVAGEHEFMLGETRVTIHRTPGHSPGSMTPDILMPSSERFGKPMRIALLGDNGYGGWHEAIGSNHQDWRESIGRLIKISDPPISHVSFGHGLTDRLVPNAGEFLRKLQTEIGAYDNAYAKLPPENFDEKTARATPDLGRLAANLVLRVEARDTSNHITDILG